MLYFIVLMGLACTGIVMSDLNEKLDICLKDVNERELTMFMRMRESPTLKNICPVVLRLKDCTDNAMEEEHTSIAEIAASQPRTHATKKVKVSINVISVMTDICTDGTDLNAGYKASIGCRKTLDLDLKCWPKTTEAVDAYLGIMDAVDEGEDGENNEEDHEELQRSYCLSISYLTACSASYIHDMCGEDAFNFYRTVAKRSSFIPTLFCTEEALVEERNDFLDSLIHEEEHHRDLFKLALHLRRRKREIMFM